MFCLVALTTDHSKALGCQHLESLFSKQELFCTRHGSFRRSKCRDKRGDDGESSGEEETTSSTTYRPPGQTKGSSYHGTLNLAMPKFWDTNDEDPSRHMERYIERLASSLIINPGYCLMWFPTTLHGEAYEWYIDYPEGGPFHRVGPDANGVLEWI